MEFGFWLKLLGIFSFCAFVGTLAAVPFIIGRMREDFFVNREKRKQERRAGNPLTSLVILCLRNSIGCILIAIGIAMLFLPGQGILTIVIGLCCMDFPKKDHLVQSLVRSPRIQRLLNWIRQKQGKAMFTFH